MAVHVAHDYTVNGKVVKQTGGANTIWMQNKKANWMVCISLNAPLLLSVYLKGIKIGKMQCLKMSLSGIRMKMMLDS